MIDEAKPRGKIPREQDRRARAQPDLHHTKPASLVPEALDSRDPRRAGRRPVVQRPRIESYAVRPAQGTERVDPHAAKQRRIAQRAKQPDVPGDDGGSEIYVLFGPVGKTDSEPVLAGQFDTG